MVYYPYKDALDRAVKAQWQVQYELGVELFVKGDIDEVAVLWDTEEALEAFVDWCKGANGADHFNSVPRDRMIRLGEETSPAMQLPREEFNVRFEFLRLPGKDWRIEALCMLDGIAPLHSAALERFGPGCVVHASFKAKDREAYKRIKGELEHDEGPFKAVPKAAEYMNSYGIFAYYGTGQVPYLKPRVNLRDTMVP